MSPTPTLTSGLFASCVDLVHACPFPMAAFHGAEHLLLYANPAFCLLSGENEESLKGKPAAECLSRYPGCVALLSRVRETGGPEQHTEEGYAEPWFYSAWPITSATDTHRVTMLQITEASELHRRARKANEALLVTAMQQHESAEIAKASAKSMGTTIAQKDHELDRTKEELRSLALQLLKAQEDERRRIARELHDNVSQQLAFVGMQLFNVRAELREEPGRSALTRIHKQIDELSSEVRVLSHQLHSPALEDLGFSVALRSLLKEFENDHNLLIYLTAQELPSSIPLPIATVLLRIVQECLWNVVKHAGADAQVRVTLSHEPGHLMLSVNDNGAGFLYDAVRGRGRLGLVGMHERAGSVNGSMEVISSPGRGTSVQVNIPWQEPPSETAPPEQQDRR